MDCLRNASPREFVVAVAIFPLTQAEAPASKPTAASAPPVDLRSASVAAALPLDAEAVVCA